VIVGASLEPTDEQVFLRAVRSVGAARPDARFLLVPHAVTANAVARLQRRAAAAGIDLEEWDHTDRTPVTCVVLVTVGGILFDLYPLADVAYMGGGFSRGKLHAVIEPAAYGLPIVLGPMHGASRDAAAVLEAAGGVSLPLRKAGDVLAATWQRWIVNPTDRYTTGLAARSTVCGGAAAVTVTHLVRFLGAPTLGQIHTSRSAP
jgi:3-deoxy-D-manno-octulosonic-acid transferase